MEHGGQRHDHMTQFGVPIALLVFNRPDTTAMVFEAIRRIKPSKLLVVADGPRDDCPEEAEKCFAVRSIIEQVDWACEVKKNYSGANLGCRRRVSSGLDWVFEQVEEAIILEDDCLPHPSFFRFCEELLDYYRHDQRIAQISGCNFQFGLRRNEDSYYFSKYNHIWGWASWRDRWQGCYDVSILNWPEIRDGGWLADMHCEAKEVAHWKKIFEQVFLGKINTWDYQWTLACWLQSRLTVLPNCNLVSNIGFDENATHTTSKNRFADIPAEGIGFPLKHPVNIVRNRIMDTRVFKSNLSVSFLSGFIDYFHKLTRP